MGQSLDVLLTPDPTPKRSTQLARWRTVGVRKPTPTSLAIKVEVAGDGLIFDTTFCQSWYSPASGVSVL
jgi:hypothetical protein